MKVHRKGYRFSIDFLIHALGYGFLFGNHKRLAFDISRIFFLIFKNHKLVGFSYEILVVLNLFHQNILYKKLTKKRATSKIWTKVKNVKKH
jgi:hypothetical protein